MRGPEETYITITELAEELNVSRAYLSKLIKQGILPKGRPGFPNTRTRMIPRLKCLEILANRPRPGRTRRNQETKQQPLDIWAQMV